MSYPLGDKKKKICPANVWWTPVFCESLGISNFPETWSVLEGGLSGQPDLRCEGRTLSRHGEVRTLPALLVLLLSAGLVCALSQPLLCLSLFISLHVVGP